MGKNRLTGEKTRKRHMAFGLLCPALALFLLLAGCVPGDWPGQSGTDGPDETAEFLEHEDSGELAERLFKDRPELDGAKIKIARDWVVTGRFTQKESPEQAVLCLYEGGDDSGTRSRYFLFVLGEGGTRTAEFSVYYRNTYYTSMSLADLTGDGLDEIIVANHRGGSGRGENLYIMTAGAGGLKTVFLTGTEDPEYPEDAPEAFDFGFYGEFLPNYGAVLKNRYLPTAHTADLSHLKGYEAFDGTFDEEGRGTGEFEFDWVERYELRDADGDGVSELICTGDIWYHVHSETVGHIRAYLKYDFAAQGFVIYKTEFEKEPV